MNKQTYVTPSLVEYGDIEQITLGSGWGLVDLFVYGLSDPIGNCGHGSCETDPTGSGG